MLAGVHELLGEEVAEAAGRLDRPRSFLERCGPSDEPIDLGLGCADLEASQLCLCVVDRNRLMGLLVRIDPDHYCHVSSVVVDG